jgi:putative transferase (TIGR04331 family)
MSDKKSRYLITTANEDTWVFDKPILFLGDWCTLKNREHVWSDLDYEVVPYYWDDQDFFLQDTQEIRGLYEEILSNFCAILNQYHNLEFSERAWRIILGPWLQRMIGIIFDRFKILEFAFSNYNISGISYTEDSLYDKITFDLVDFGNEAKTDNWNYLIYSFLYINIFKNNYQNCQSKSLGLSNYLEFKKINKVKKNADLKSIIKPKLLYFYIFLSNLLMRKNETYLYSVYLGGKTNILKLNYFLGNVPLIVKSFYSNYKNKLNNNLTVNIKVRKELGSSLYKKSDIGSNNAVLLIMMKVLPLCYLEGFNNLYLITKNKFLYPKKQKQIITSVGLWQDELFKIWAAQKVQRGSVLIAMQHGGEYGSSLFSLYEEHEIDVSDKFLSWGWGSKLEKVIPVPMLIRKSNIDNKVNCNNSEIVIVCTVLIRYLTSLHPGNIIGGKKEKYYNKIVQFLEYLVRNNKQFIVRTFPTEKERGDSISERLKHDIPNIKISSTDNYNKLINEAKLVIHTYDGTSFLEGILSKNPCMLLVDPSITPLRDSAKPFFDKLVGVGICHYSTDSLISKIDNIDNDFNKWWNEENVISVREMFANNFAYNAVNPVQYLSNVIGDLKK